MKNRIRPFLLTLCAVTASFALTACGGSGDKSPAGDTAQNHEDTTDKEEAAGEEESTVSGKFASIQEFIESDIMQEQLAAQTESLAESGMTLELTGEGSQLIYNFIIKDKDLSTLLASDPGSLESTLESQASTYSSVAASLTEAIDVEDPVVVVRYTGNDGTELFSKEFPASSDAGTDNTDEDASADTAAE